jgi:hypothetical protein
MCVCMSLALQGKTNYLFGFQENMFILLILCALKGQGHEVLEIVSEGCTLCLKHHLQNVSIVSFCFFFLATRGGHIQYQEREIQSRETAALTAEVHVYRESHASKLCRCRGNHYQTCHSQALNISSTGEVLTDRMRLHNRYSTVLYVCRFDPACLPPPPPS